MNKYEARKLLPKVGDQRWEIPTADETGGPHTEKAPQRGIVVDVNAAHLWYTVQFENGFKESYKVPKYRSPYGGGSK